MNHDMPQISVLGLGAMGRALAGAFLERGLATTVWNRSAGKADDLVARGARPAATVADALAADLAILCLLDYDAVRDVLAPVADRLTGRTLVNLTNGAPAEARTTAEWTAERGAAYLDGAIMAVPPTIGAPDAFVLLSGDEPVLARVRPAIAVLGEPVDVGRDPGLAALYDMALLSSLYGMDAGAHHAVALVAAGGGDVETFKRTLLSRWMAQMLPFTAGLADPAGSVPETFNAAMQAAGIEHILATSSAHGIDAARAGHLEAALALMRTAAGTS